MKELSMQVVKDGEGLSKLIKVNVCKSQSLFQAKKLDFLLSIHLL